MIGSFMVMRDGSIVRMNSTEMVLSGEDVDAAVYPPLIIDESPRLTLAHDALGPIEERVALATERLLALESSSVFAERAT
jgi:hypothetical protein